MSATWSYRIIEHEDDGSGNKWHAIHEVHYEDDKPYGYVEDPATVTASAHAEPPLFRVTDFQWQLDRMSEAIIKPVLRAADFERDPE